MKLQKYTEFQPLLEARFEDTHSPAFVEFVARYKQLIASGKLKHPDKIFIQFTNLKDNALDKTIYDTPDHADPVGVYGYPLDYVLHHPADIWYGAAAQNLRVLEDTSRAKLVLSGIRTLGALKTALGNIGIHSSDYHRVIKMAQANFPNRFTGVNMYGKLFLSILQMDMEGTRGDYGKVGTFPGKEQSRRLLLGYDAIEDRSKTIDDAIINDREPEQICFLKRSAFKVVEVVRLHRSHKKPAHIVNAPPDVRKLAALLAQGMDDKLMTAADVAYNGTRGTFWTRRGRRIELEFSVPSSYRTELNLGQKHHRYGTDADHRVLDGHVYTEWGKLSVDGERDTPYAEVIEDLLWWFEKAQEKGERDAAFHPENKAGYEKRLADEAEAKRKADIKEGSKKYEAEHLTRLVALRAWAKKLGIALPACDDHEVCVEAGRAPYRVISGLEYGFFPPAEAEDHIDFEFDPENDAREYYGAERYAFLIACRETFRTLVRKHPEVFADPKQALAKFMAV